MHGIHSLDERHAVLDARPGHYLCFPDLWRAPSGEVLCVYREADVHVATRRRLLAARSADGGRTWSGPDVLHPATGHCPRISEPEPGLLAVIDDAGRLIHRSRDQGRTWTATPYAGMPPGVPDRILTLEDGTWLSAAHRHEGEENPLIRQPPPVQRVFASRDRGRTWEAVAVLGGDTNLALCEASMARLPDGSILALMRENSQVFEPMHLCRSTDGGRTWSGPRPTRLVGHRPSLGLTRDGRLLATFRNLGPAGGTAAWLGTPEELEGFAVQGPGGPEPDATAQGLRLEPDPEGRPAFYALRPLRDPLRARATLEAEVTAASEAEGGGLLRLGLAWRVLADRMEPLLPEAPGPDEALRGLRIPLPRGTCNAIRLEYDRGGLEVFVNGRPMAVLDLEPGLAARRPVLFGAAPGAEGASLWRRVRQSGLEADGQTPYVWAWEAGQGPPDARARAGCLLLADARGAAWCDYGYSGWVEMERGSFLCAYHHADASEPDYRPGESSRVVATRFSASDFSF